MITCKQYILTHICHDLLNRCKKWVINTRRGDLDHLSAEQLYKNYRICAKHFEDSQFMNPNKNKLVWNAVPTLFDVPNPPAKITPPRSIARKRQCQEVLLTSKRHRGKTWKCLASVNWSIYTRNLQLYLWFHWCDQGTILKGNFILQVKMSRRFWIQGHPRQSIKRVAFSPTEQALSLHLQPRWNSGNK